MANTFLPGKKLCEGTTNGEERKNFILILQMVLFWNWSFDLPHIDNKEVQAYTVPNIKGGKTLRDSLFLFSLLFLGTDLANLCIFTNRH